MEQNKREFCYSNLYKAEFYSYSTSTLGKQMQASPVLCMHLYCNPCMDD